ncbi:MAG: TonB-dependent receptor plug domain-containing protein, partial [Muribaculaceae bacterium]|nr:TonB-dependent receptor plug domain-containing protein [Muribaculaceae bacterium]
AVGNIAYLSSMKKIAVLFIFIASVFILETPAFGSELPDTVKGENLEELIVTGESAVNRLSSIRLGAENVELSKMSLMPVLFGENDIIKSISFLPGVHSEGDGAGGFEVRGGTSGQNLILLDGMTLYNPTHVMGIFSTFNDQAIGRATLYKGPIPAFYGEASSSVLETTLAPGNMETYHGEGTIGLLAAKIMAGGPIVKDKLSFAVTARRSYVDMFLKMVPKYRDIVMNFYDVTAKFRYRPRPDDTIDLSFIASHDNMAIGGVMGMYWGNIAGSADWTARRGDSWRFNTTGAYTSFSTKMSMTIMNDHQLLREYIRNASVNENISYSIDDEREIEFGLRSELLRVQSADFTLVGNRERDIRSGWVNAGWINYEGLLTGKVFLSGGIRLSLFTSLTGNRWNTFNSIQEEVPDYRSKSYFIPEPRISVKYNITESHNIKAGVSATTQSLHSIRSSTTSFPFDRYALSSSVIKPELTWQYAAGYSGMTADGGFDWSVEGYYKDMRNVYDYKDGAGMFSRLNLEDIILGGKGRSYGAEFMIRKNNGKLTGWISYSISKTQSRIAGINGDRWYNATNDRRHDLSVVGIYRFNNRWNVAGTWVFSSGTPLTAPDDKYELSGTTIYYYSQRNAYRTPPTHRLDLSATYTHVGRKLTYEWSFGIYNLYCRYNPYVVYFEDDPHSPSGSRAVLQAMFGIVPSVSYTLRF